MHKKLNREERALKTQLLELSERMPSTKNVTVSKDQIRQLYTGKRLSVMASMNGQFERHIELIRKHVASPNEIDLTKINPSLSVVSAGTYESQLFSAASLFWSIPVSRGFGRRIRYLVIDKNNEKLIGIIGLTDPVFNLTPRDAWIGWDAEGRMERLVHTMDAFVLGALPPYNRILGGKLTALLATSSEVIKHFNNKYSCQKGVISTKTKNPRLVLLTTSSALGRSSIYSRLRIPQSIEFMSGIEKHKVPTWYTKGYGHFHIDDKTFKKLQKVLLRRNHPYAKGNRFGDGPNWRIRVIRQALVDLGIRADLLHHGIRRQVYVVPLARNTREILQGKKKRPDYISKTTKQITDYWLERWARPRADRFPDWRSWSLDHVISELQELHDLTDKQR